MKGIVKGVPMTGANLVAQRDADVAFANTSVQTFKKHVSVHVGHACTHVDQAAAWHRQEVHGATLRRGLPAESVTVSGREALPNCQG